MFNVGGPEVLVIALVALVVVGPEQLPSLLRKAGRYASQARDMSANLRREFMAGVDEIDPTKWDNERERGTGEAATPIVPKGYAERVAAGEDGNPFKAKPKSQVMAEPTPEEALAEAEAEADRAEKRARAAAARADRLRADAAPRDPDAPPINRIAEANARRSPEPEVDPTVDDPIPVEDAEDAGDLA